MIVSGTGHRPDKLGGYDDTTKLRLVNLAEAWLLKNNPTRVISGGALGWDQGLAEAALLYDYKLTFALPFPGFEDRWPDQSKKFLYAMMNRADEVKYVCEEGYAGWKMQKRNEWMVDNSDLVLALWNGTNGGTSNCVGYAKKKNKPIYNLWEQYEREAAAYLRQ